MIADGVRPLGMAAVALLFAYRPSRRLSVAITPRTIRIQAGFWCYFTCRRAAKGQIYRDLCGRNSPNSPIGRIIRG
jgi:hypothetical protein